MFFIVLDLRLTKGWSTAVLLFYVFLFAIICLDNYYLLLENVCADGSAELGKDGLFSRCRCLFFYYCVWGVCCDLSLFFFLCQLYNKLNMRFNNL